MKSIALLLIIGFGIAAGGVASAYAERMPTDLWERIGRERY